MMLLSMMLEAGDSDSMFDIAEDFVVDVDDAPIVGQLLRQQKQDCTCQDVAPWSFAVVVVVAVADIYAVFGLVAVHHVVVLSQGQQEMGFFDSAVGLNYLYYSASFATKIKQTQKEIIKQLCSHAA